MDLKTIHAELDAGIARLQQAKTVLSSANASGAPAVHKGRPKNAVATPAPAKPVKKKRNLSPEGRARIAEAVKRRWAAHKA
jgi:hypothetical protein